MEPDERQLELLGALEALGGSAGNGRIREMLGWDEASYESVKAPSGDDWGAQWLSGAAMKTNHHRKRIIIIAGPIGLVNFERDDQRAVDAWQLIDNGGSGPALVAEGDHA